MPSASQRFSQRETVSGWRGRRTRARAVAAGGTPDAMRRNVAVRSRQQGVGDAIAQVFKDLPLRDAPVKGPVCRQRTLLSEA